MKATTDPPKPVEDTDGTVPSPEAGQSQPEEGGPLTEPGSQGEPGSEERTAERPNRGSNDDGEGALEQSVAGPEEAGKLPGEEAGKLPGEEAGKLPGEEAGGGSSPTAFSRGRSSISKSRQLSGGQFSGGRLSGGRLSGGQLSGEQLSGGRLSGGQFSGGAALRWAALRGGGCVRACVWC